MTKGDKKGDKQLKQRMDLGATISSYTFRSIFFITHNSVVF